MTRESETRYIPAGVRGIGVETHKFIKGGHYHDEEGAPISYRTHQTEDGKRFTIERHEGENDLFVTFH